MQIRIHKRELQLYLENCVLLEPALALKWESSSTLRQSLLFPDPEHDGPGLRREAGHHALQVGIKECRLLLVFFEDFRHWPHLAAVM